MRFILIDPRHRRTFDLATPVQLSEEFICRELRCDVAHCVNLAPDLDLWVSYEWKPRSFRLFADGQDFAGAGILCGRTKLGEIKGLPRWLTLEAVSKWVNWPTPSSEIRLRQNERPTAVSLSRPSLSIPYHRDRLSAGEPPYLMQMYG